MLRPHVLAKDHLCIWCPIGSRLEGHLPGSRHSTDQFSFSEEDCKQITDVLTFAWEEDTRESYGSGLLVYYVFCDMKQVPEASRAPASQLLLSGFMSNLAASYTGKTISSYLYGVRAWHILHGVPWHLEKAEMDTILHAAEKLTPPSSKRKPRQPYTPDFIAALRRHLDLNNSLDAAVFACLTCCFYASACLGEFTVRKLDGFDPARSVTRKAPYARQGSKRPQSHHLTSAKDQNLCRR